MNLIVFDFKGWYTQGMMLLVVVMDDLSFSTILLPPCIRLHVSSHANRIWGVAICSDYDRYVTASEGSIQVFPTR